MGGLNVKKQKDLRPQEKVINAYFHVLPTNSTQGIEQFISPCAALTLLWQTELFLEKSKEAAQIEIMYN